MSLFHHFFTSVIFTFQSAPSPPVVTSHWLQILWVAPVVQNSAIEDSLQCGHREYLTEKFCGRVHGVLRAQIGITGQLARPTEFEANADVNHRRTWCRLESENNRSKEVMK